MNVTGKVNDTVEVGVFPYDTARYFGVRHLGIWSLCCTDQLYSLNLCSRPNRMIVNLPANSTAPYFNFVESGMRIEGLVSVGQTHEWYVISAFCGLGEKEVSGVVEFKVKISFP